MQTTNLGALGPVSRLTLGGGGIGRVWGETSWDEAIATLHAAIDAGITVLDAAPIYADCQAMIGEAFEGRLPDGVRITTKYGVGTVPAGEVYDRFRRSLEESLKTMRIDSVDAFFLHNEICPDDFAYPDRYGPRDEVATTLSLYRDAVVPAMERLREEGLIGVWGITAVSVVDAIQEAIRTAPHPQVVQCIANLLDNPGGLTVDGAPGRPRSIIATAREHDAGVMGIRAVQAGALTSALDRDADPMSTEKRDYDRAAPYRALCAEWGEDPAYVAHRYALSVEGVDTLVLGVKNRGELKSCLDAEAAGPLEPERVDAIDALGLR